MFKNHKAPIILAVLVAAWSLAMIVVTAYKDGLFDGCKKAKITETMTIKEMKDVEVYCKQLND